MVSIRYFVGIYYAGTYECFCELDRGTFYLVTRQSLFYQPVVFAYYPLDPDARYIREEEGTHFLGFAIASYPAPRRGGGLGVPFWFLTAFTTALLWLVWRKTRPKPRGFPVELAKPIGEKGGNAG